MNADSRIRALVQANLMDDHKVKGVEFVDELLLVAAEVGQIRCSLTGEDGLRFQTPEQPAWDVKLGRANSKLRMLCARLAVLCAADGRELALYGGEGSLSLPSAGSPNGESTKPGRLTVRYHNRPGDVEFTIEAAQRSGASSSDRLHHAAIDE